MNRLFYPMSPRRRGTITGPMVWRAVVASLLLVILCALAACSAEQPTPLPPRPVLTVAVQQRLIHTFGPFAATIDPRYQTQLGFQIAGRMAARDVQVGDLVKKGQRLAALDTTVPRFQLTVSQADLADAQAQLANAAATETRQKALVQGGNTPQSQVDSAAASRLTAKARLDQAEANLRKVRDQLGYTELHADFDGVVTAWSTEVGQVVTNGQAVVTMARPDVREAVVDIPDSLIDEMKALPGFHVALQADLDVTATGHIREIAPAADSATRLRRIRLSLDAPPEGFRLGTTVDVSASTPIAPEIDLPPTAILEADGKTGVWIVDAAKKTVGLKPVRVLRRDGVVTIAGDFPPGTLVVTAGVHTLTEGQAVRLIDEIQS